MTDLAAVQPADPHTRPGINTRADFDLWLDGFDSGAATVLRTLADAPADKLPAVVAALNRKSRERDAH
ncbi:hypothetical protein ABZY58_10995 [Micromonospora tulbaghiae]|uniref:hypothetical protein n=1 Tax=Micromonospora tulbaghiae TaxID=479978 RepID=UPI0033AF914F